MIKQLRFKFVILSMIALFILLGFVIIGINIMNYRQMIIETDDTLRIIAENGGIFPDFRPDIKNDRPNFMTPETPYETRYFSVLFDSKEDILFVDTKFITAVDSNQAIKLALEALRSNKAAGFIDQYRYLRTSDKLLTRIIFLDCGRKLHSYRIFLITSVKMALAGYAGFFVALLFFSKRIVAPAAESYEKQKRFITDAGHEIKTPLTVIKADADVIEMEYGTNEWLSDIKKQTDRLVALTNNLVYLSRMEETGQRASTIEFPLSDIINDIATSFSTLARSLDKDFRYEIQPHIRMRGNEKAIIELTEILLDNAVKYTPDHGIIILRLSREKNNIRIWVENTVDEPISAEACKLIFERFYRLDASRNSDTGGSGIGLSVAKAIVEAHGGKISAETNPNKTFEITVQLPA